MQMNQTELKELQSKIWNDYSDLDHWIRDMNKTDTQRMSKYVLKIAMKHFRNDMLLIHRFLTKHIVTDGDLHAKIRQDTIKRP